MLPEMLLSSMLLTISVPVLRCSLMLHAYAGLLAAICTSCPVLAALLHPPAEQQQQQQRQQQQQQQAKPGSTSCALLAVNGVLIVYTRFVRTQPQSSTGHELLATKTGLPMAGLLMAVVRAYPATSSSSSSSNSSSSRGGRRVGSNPASGMMPLVSGFMDASTGRMRTHLGTLNEQVAALKATVSGDGASAAAQRIMYKLSQSISQGMVMDACHGMNWLSHLATSPPAAVQDLVVMLYVQMAWAAQQQQQQQQQQHDRRSMQQGRQQQQQVPAWHEQFLAAVGAGPWDPASCMQQPDPGSALTEMCGAVYAVNRLFIAVEAMAKNVPLQDQSLERLIACSSSRAPTAGSAAAAGSASSYAHYNTSAASCDVAQHTASEHDSSSAGSSGGGGGRSDSTNPHAGSDGGSGSSSSRRRSSSSTAEADIGQQQQRSWRDRITELQSSLPYPEVLLLLIEMMVLAADSPESRIQQMVLLMWMRFRSLHWSAYAASGAAAAAVAVALVQPVLHHLGPMLLPVTAGSSSSSSSSGSGGGAAAGSSASAAAYGLDELDDRLQWYASIVSQLLGAGAKL
jgi:hypothetical protein